MVTANEWEKAPAAAGRRPTAAGRRFARGRRRFAAVVAALAVVVAGCAGGGGPPVERPTLTVSAAASLMEPLEEVRARYEALHPGVTIRVNYGSSGGLQKQIEMGLPADLFFAAARLHMDQLVAQGFIDETLHATLLTNALVVVVPVEAVASPDSVAALADPAWSRIAIGVPETAPVGAYAKEALERAGVWERVRAKAAFGVDARKVLAAVETGNADAGFVYATDARASGRVRVAFEVPAEQHTPIEYPIGVVATTSRPTEAEAFYSFLRSEEALAAFEARGFGTVRP